MIRRFLSVGVLLLVSAVSWAQPSVLDRALSDEMKRSLEELRLGEEPRPYFLSYRVDDLETMDLSATFGSPLRRRISLDRVLSVEVRVGSAERDNTNFFSFGRRSAGLTRSWNGSAQAPIGDSYTELRRQLWLLSDEAYKSALEDFARKSAALENRRQADELPDFAPAAQASVAETIEAGAPDADAAESLIAEISETFRRHPTIDHSEVHLRCLIQRSRYLNSEGSSFVRSVPIIELRITASTQAEDGMPLADVAAYYGRGLEDLPGREKLTEVASRLAQRLADSSRAQEIDRYNGPVLFTGQAAAELLHQVLAPQLSAFRQPVAESEEVEKRVAGAASSLNDRIGGRVLSRTMRLTDEPLTAEAESKALFGGFQVDDDGVRAYDKVLVERGILKSLVSGRNPSRGVERSTGNRRGIGPLVSNLLLSTSDGRSDEELRRELMQLMDERELDFGIIVRRLVNPRLLAGLGFGGGANGAGGRDEAVEGVIEAVKVYRDGREESIRSPRFPGLSAASFRDIVAASAHRTVYSAPLRSAHSGVSLFASATLTSYLIGPPIVSVVVPDLLFEELTVTAPVAPVPRKPVIPHPFFADGTAD